MTDRTKAERALAFLVHEIRDGWQEAGIVVALRKVTDRPLAEVTAAALYCAVKRTDQRSPDCIWRDGEHWQALARMTDGKATDPVPPYLAVARCPKHHESLPCLACQRPAQVADIDTIRRLRAEARASTEGNPA